MESSVAFHVESMKNVLFCYLGATVSGFGIAVGVSLGIGYGVGKGSDKLYTRIMNFFYLVSYYVYFLNTIEIVGICYVCYKYVLQGLIKVLVPLQTSLYVCAVCSKLQYPQITASKLWHPAPQRPPTHHFPQNAKTNGTSRSCIFCQYTN